jgi:peptidoglycan/LPS O-acetylase OafA/YrhL
VAVPLVSWVLFRAVERPSIQMGRRLSRRPKPKPLAEVEAQAAP